MKKAIILALSALPLFTGCYKQKQIPYDGMPFETIYIREEYEFDEVGVILYENPEDSHNLYEICFEPKAYREIVEYIREDFGTSGTLKQIANTQDGTPVFTLE